MSLSAAACVANEKASSDASVAAARVASGGSGGNGGSGGGYACPMPIEECAPVGSLLFGACVSLADPGALDGGTSSSGGSEYETIEFQLTGTVDSVDDAPFDCQRSGFGESGAGTRTFVVSDGDVALNVAVELPDALPLLAVGDRVSVDYVRNARGSFDEGPPPAGHLELRDGDGELILWMARALDVERLSPPQEVAVEDGSMRCQRETSLSPCSEILLSLDVTIEDDTVEVPYRETRNLGDYAVLHGENREVYLGEAFVAVVRGAL